MQDRDLYKLIDNLDMQEENQEVEYVDDWYCQDCEHGPMTESDDRCTRCGTKNSQYQGEEITGWEDEDEMEGVEEIW